MTKPTTKRFYAAALLGFMLSTAAVPVTAQTLDELAARGEVLASIDPLATDLRGKLDEPGRRGFDIGMGVAEGHTAPGPGKQKRGEELPLDQQVGYFAAVEFSVTRNANAMAASVGFRIAQNDPRLTEARLTGNNPFYALGFDIATGLLSDRSGRIQSPLPNLDATIAHNSLRGAAKSGFEASANLHGRSFSPLPTKSTAGSVLLGTGPSATDGTEGVDRVGSVPNVVGLRAADAEAALTKAGYKFTETTVKGVNPRPPFDVVTGTLPPAGTGLAHGSNVRYQIIEAAILNGTGALNKNDFDNRLGFDLDTGKYAQITHGADMYMTPSTELHCQDLRRDLALCGRGESLLEAGTGGRVVILKKVYALEVRDQGEVNVVVSDPLRSRRYFLACGKAFSGEPLKYKISIGDLYVDQSNSFGDKLAVNTVCVNTAEGRLAVVRFAPQESNGNHQFEFALFPDYQRVKPQARIKLDPAAPPSALSKLSICEKAKIARDRGSPAAPGLTKQCLDGGGTVPP